MTLATATTTPRSDTNPIRVIVDPLHLDEIPDIMDAMNWHTAAKLMRHWFNQEEAYVMTADIRSGKVSSLSLPPNRYNDDIVKIDWLLSHPMWHAAAINIHNSWVSPKGIDRLKILLKKEGWIRGKTTPTVLGSIIHSARECDTYSQVNKVDVGNKLNRVDGLYGAIGNGTLKIAVVGTAFNRHGRDFFRVEKTGLYLRDSYDFEGDNEPLGIWSKKRNKCLGKLDTVAYLSSPLYFALQGYVPVFNRDFRCWQEVHKNDKKKGGDFIVYSDVQWRNESGWEIPL
ncbi:DUF6402 family protein [Tolumonas osonensis]|uniref:Uncharacterized protein n=1 Tax=Tolumonas osonensis TaxID=675874 RepID=A0A841GHM1_9GAMM|nr:DUF6402 family protein [Tolumonas osonensis]MBB6056156.1 hypothetical protein [Tolumonas osonensis]